MNPHRLPLSFAVAKPNTLDAMEAVLAIARRGGCELADLTVRAGPRDTHVALELHAPDPDLLALFLTRLQNLFDVSDITILTARVDRQAQRHAILQDKELHDC